VGYLEQRKFGELERSHAAESLDAITGQTPAPIPADQEAAIVRWLAAIGETDQAIIADVLTTCGHDEGARAYCLGRAAHVATDDLDDRRSCRQCRNLRAGVCIVAKPGSAVSATRGYRPAAPEMLRRCDGACDMNESTPEKRRRWREYHALCSTEIRRRRQERGYQAAPAKLAPHTPLT
jgi:hypothetical protein